MNEKMIQELISGLRQIYGNDLVKITLYGSYARGNQTEESDIDIAYDQYQQWVGAMPFYKNIEKEGITLWMAA